MKDFRNLAATYSKPSQGQKKDKPERVIYRSNPFFYPFSVCGIVNMSIIFLLLVVAHFAFYVFSQLSSYLYLFRGIRLIGLAAIGYFFMYLSECMFDSGKGGVSAPDTMPGSNGLDELLEELTWGILPLILCFLPVMIVLTVNEGNFSGLIALLWLLGAVLFPMLSIRSLMLRSLSAFNPFATVCNIIRFFPDYLVLLLAIMVLCVPSYLISRFLSGAICYSIMLLWLIYGCVVFWHLMGRFYFKHRALLDWE